MRTKWLVSAVAGVLVMVLVGCSTPAAKVSMLKVNAAGQKEFVGTVSKVVDGDTLVVKTDKGDIKVRMSGIDAPEMKQSFGPEAKDALSQRVDGKKVRVVWRADDKYGRVVGDVYEGYKWVNLDMVFAGMAWHYKAYSKDARMASVEANVRKHGVGLWKQKDPVAPWDFRKSKGDAE